MRLAVLLCLVLAGSPAAWAQEPPPQETRASLEVANVTRLESWSYFEPHPGGGDPTYTLLSNRATAGVRVTAPRFDVYGAFEYGQLLGIPRRAIGPGALGPGALYFQAAQATEAFQLYFRALSVRAKSRAKGLSIEVGRMGYMSGATASSGVAAVDAVRRARVDARLIGEFEWSMFRRAFDGIRFDIDRPRWHGSGALIFPTQGGYEESANPTISKLRLLSGEWTVRTGASEPPSPAGLAELSSHSQLQVFAYHYRDRRDVLIRPDNTGRLAEAVDIDLTTFGVSHVGVYPVRAGHVDTVLWFAGQAGDWYGDRHRALSLALEGGYQWRTGWRPLLRGGLLHASGDDNPVDRRHGTFFQMVPTSRRYSRSQTYAQMNIRDYFAQFEVQPTVPVRLRGEVHRVALADPADRWYGGSGATAREGLFFGYTGRLSLGGESLGTIVEASADVAVSRPWTVAGYIGWMKGGDVVDRSFAGDRLVFVYLMSTLNF